MVLCQLQSGFVLVAACKNELALRIARAVSHTDMRSYLGLLAPLQLRS